MNKPTPDHNKFCKQNLEEFYHFIVECYNQKVLEKADQKILNHLKERKRAVLDRMCNF